MTSSRLATPSYVRADVNYIRNPPPRGAAVLQFVTEDDRQTTMETLPGRPMRIADARSLATDLDREGFELVRHVSTVGDFNRIQEDSAVDQCYVEEMATLLSEVTGAA
jgi:hypothetical protein